MYPKELKAKTQIGIYTIVFIAGLLIAKCGTNLKHPWMDEWINKIWYIHTMGYHSALKRNETSYLQQYR